MANGTEPFRLVTPVSPFTPVTQRPRPGTASVVVAAQHVRPGDLITASFINQLLDFLVALERRVAALEDSAPSRDTVVVTGLVPPSGRVRVGDFLEVHGQNFGHSTGSLRAFIDDRPIDALDPRTNDQLLVFRVPLTITDVPQAGRPALLTVSNQTSSAQRTLFLESAIVLAGSVDVIARGAASGTPATPTPGNPYVLEFTIRSRANLEATFTLSATVSVAANQAQWQSNLRILDTEGRPASQIVVAPGQENTFRVGISPIPPGTNGVAFSISTSATAGSVSGSSGPQGATVGTAAEQPDNTISLNHAFGEVLPAGSAGSVTTTRMVLPQESGARLSLDATFELVGLYNLSATLQSGTSNWEAVVMPGMQNPLPITEADLRNPQGRAAKTLEFAVQPRPGASASGTVEFKVQRQGASQSRRRAYELALSTRA